MGNNTGGLHPGKGWGPYEDGAGKSCDTGSNSVGTAKKPDISANPKPGGKGSRGSASKSSPSGK